MVQFLVGWSNFVLLSHWSSLDDILSAYIRDFYSLIWLILESLKHAPRLLEMCTAVGNCDRSSERAELF